MVQRLDHLKESPSQTAGPYVHIGTNPNWAEITGVWEGDLGLVLVGPDTRGERILVKGRIFDGLGKPLNDALVEIWQADADGLHNSPEERRGRADPNFRRLGAPAHPPRHGRVPLRNHQAGPRAPHGRPPDGAAHHGLHRGGGASTSGCTRGCISVTRRSPTPNARC